MMGGPSQRDRRETEVKEGQVPEIFKRPMTQCSDGNATYRACVGVSPDQSESQGCGAQAFVNLNCHPLGDFQCMVLCS